LVSSDRSPTDSAVQSAIQTSRSSSEIVSARSKKPRSPKDALSEKPRSSKGSRFEKPKDNSNSLKSGRSRKRIVLTRRTPRASADEEPEMPRLSTLRSSTSTQYARSTLSMSVCASPRGSYPSNSNAYPRTSHPRTSNGPRASYPRTSNGPQASYSRNSYGVRNSYGLPRSPRASNGSTLSISRQSNEMDLTRPSFGKKAVYGRKRGHYGRGLKYNKHKPVDRKAILREIARENRGNPSFGKFDNWNNQKSIGQVIEQLEQNPFDCGRPGPCCPQSLQ